MTGSHASTNLPSEYRDLATATTLAGAALAAARWRGRLRLYAIQRASARAFRSLEPVAQGPAPLHADAGRMGEPDHPARDRRAVPGRACHRRQDRDRRGSLDAGVLALCRPGHQAAGAAGRQRRQGPAAVRDRSRRHRAGAERFHRGDDRDEQGEVRARSRRDPGQARQGSVRGQGGAAEGLSAEPGQPDPGAERHALVADGAGGVAQQAADPRLQRGRHRNVPRQGPHQSGNHDLCADRAAPWCSARSAPANMSTPAPAIRST